MKSSEMAFISNPRRDVSATIAGFVFQVNVTILRWLELRDKEHLELECGEDIDTVHHGSNGGTSAETRLLEQIMSYSTPLSYSVRLIAITNGNFSSETQSEASQHGIRLLDRRELMSQLRRTTLTMGRVYARESDRCKSFDEGIRSAKKWFQG